MKKSITNQQYTFALERIEALLPLVEEHTPAADKLAVELTLMSDIVIEYEQEHYPIASLSVAELLEVSIEENGITKKEFAGKIGVSQSRVSDYLAGRSEPSLKIARLICEVLNIPPATLLGFRES